MQNRPSNCAMLAGRNAILATGVRADYGIRRYVRLGRIMLVRMLLTLPQDAVKDTHLILLKSNLRHYIPNTNSAIGRPAGFLTQCIFLDYVVNCFYTT